jgi:hypothetical protein
MDLTIQAVSGLISTTGFADGPPVKAGPAIVDFLSGIHLYAADHGAVRAASAQEKAGWSKSRCKKPPTPPSPRILTLIGSQAVFHRERATAAIRARRSTSIPPMTAM